MRAENTFWTTLYIDNMLFSYDRTVAPKGADLIISDDLVSAIAEVRNDKEPTNWVVAGFEDGDLKKPLMLVAKGEGGC